MTSTIIRRALISVSDKTGVVEFARGLGAWNIDIISTGGTLKTLREAGVQARSISDVTGFPEILDGRVKTLHPKIHAAILAVESDPTHRRQIEELGIEPIDLVVVNLYPFEETVSRGPIGLDDAIEQIDIGGPAMLRAAAKNFRSKTVIVDPRRYASIIEEMKAHGGSVSGETRFALAAEVFLRTARYDSVIHEFFSSQKNVEDLNALPGLFTLSHRKSFDLRYGENPHQRAALYGDFERFFTKLHGKQLSYNNIVDIQAAAELLEEFAEPAVVIIKHTNPCGVGTAPMLADAYAKAFATDTKSAFGGIVAVNRPLDLQTAKAIDEIFTEVLIAPQYPEDILTQLRRKKDRRLMKQTRPLAGGQRWLIKPVAGGALLQTPDDHRIGQSDLRCVTKRAPTEEEHRALLFAWRVVKHVKSNAIVYTAPDRTLGIGAGQMSRFDSSRIAVMKALEAGLDLNGSVVASDAFFPFADGLLEAVKAGATAVIQPGGSIRDEEVIRAADEHNIAMVMTGIRHFKH